MTVITLNQSVTQNPKQKFNQYQKRSLKQNSQPINGILSPQFSVSIPKPVFFPTSPEHSTNKCNSIHPLSENRINYTKKTTLRARSTSPVQSQSKYPKAISVNPEISRPRSASEIFRSLHSSTAPRKLATSPVHHKHYAEGAYANPPHPSELGHPIFA